MSTRFTATGDPGPVDGLWDGLAGDDASRAFAAMQALERIGSPEAREVLEKESLSPR